MLTVINCLCFGFRSTLDYDNLFEIAVDIQLLVQTQNLESYSNNRKCASHRFFYLSQQWDCNLENACGRVIVKCGLVVKIYEKNRWKSVPCGIKF